MISIDAIYAQVKKRGENIIDNIDNIESIVTPIADDYL
jgi:hypothetical protein